MKRRVVVINFCMLMGIVLMAMRFISAWESFQEVSSVEQIAGGTGRGAMAGPSGVAPMGPPPPFSDFIVISERNLFAEDRRPPAVEEVPEGGETAKIAETPPKWVGRPTLHGVFAMGAGRQAILTVFEGAEGAGQMRTVGVGDSVQGYQVAAIEDSMVRLRWKELEEVIEVADAQAAPPAGKSAAAAITVITVGSAPKAQRATAPKAGGEAVAGLEVAVVGGGRSNPAAEQQSSRTQASEDRSSQTSAQSGRQSRRRR
ncbi:MAG: hypothetical protein V3R94_03410 [Acidobacteriota bacterium]